MSHNDRILVSSKLEEGELHPVAVGMAAVFSTNAPGKAQNEDAAAVLPYDDRSGVLVVADGAGGLPSAAKASELTISALQKAITKARKDKAPLRSAILDGIETANKNVQELGVGAGTTVAVVEIQADKLRTYHVGDSQIMVVGQRGKIKLVTTSHSPVGYAVHAGLMNEAEAMEHDERHLVSNLLGSADMRIEIGMEVSLAPRDTIVVASDGLYDNLMSDEITESIRKGPLLAISRELRDACTKRMIEEPPGKPSKPDDLTYIIYRRRLTAAS